MSIAFLLQGRLCPNLFTEHSCSSLALQNLCPSLLLEEKCSILRGLLAGDLGLWILISGLAIHSGATGQILPYLLPQSGNEQRPAATNGAETTSGPNENGNPISRTSTPP